MNQTARCADCGIPQYEMRDEFRDGVCFRCRMSSISFGSGIKLKAEREGGYTQRMLVKETIDAAKADGREIQRVGSRWI
jgi:hypothetical protein